MSYNETNQGSTLRQARAISADVPTIAMRLDALAVNLDQLQATASEVAERLGMGQRPEKACGNNDPHPPSLNAIDALDARIGELLSVVSDAQYLLAECVRQVARLR